LLNEVTQAQRAPFFSVSQTDQRGERDAREHSRRSRRECCSDRRICWSDGRRTCAVLGGRGPGRPGLLRAQVVMAFVGGTEGRIESCQRVHDRKGSFARGNCRCGVVHDSRSSPQSMGLHVLRGGILGMHLLYAHQRDPFTIEAARYMLTTFPFMISLTIGTRRLPKPMVRALTVGLLILCVLGSITFGRGQFEIG
jgi:hypothetical protein